MFNQTSTIQSTKIPTFLPLAEAAEKYGLSKKVLTQMIQAGKIEAVQLPSGELLVAAEYNGYQSKTREQVIAEKFAGLRGQSVTVSEAASIYELHERTIRRWIESGYIRIIDDSSYPVRIDKADIAYCEDIYRQFRGKRGVRIFDDNGSPYQLKHPKLAEYRQHKQGERKNSD